MSEPKKMQLPTVLIMTSVEPEKEAIEKGLAGSPIFKVATMGVGPARAAARTAAELTAHSYTYVINMGIAGGFAGKADITSAVVANRIIAADLGSESEEGFLPIEQLGMGESTIEVDAAIAQRLVEQLNKDEISASYAPILTLATVTGTKATANALQTRFPDAAAEAMEGHGVATAAQLAGLPVLEIRTISNQIGPRDRDSWKIKEALQTLERVAHALSEVWS